MIQPKEQREKRTEENQRHKIIKVLTDDHTLKAMTEK